MWMNHYTCSKCGLVSVVSSNEAEIKNVKCTCGTEPVTLKKGKLTLTAPAPQNKVAAPTLPIPAGRPLAKPPQVFNASAQSQIKSAPQGGSAPVVISTPQAANSSPSPSTSGVKPVESPAETPVELAPGTVVKVNPDGTADVVKA